MEAFGSTPGRVDVAGEGQVARTKPTTSRDGSRTRLPRRSHRTKLERLQGRRQIFGGLDVGKTRPHRLITIC